MTLDRTESTPDSELGQKLAKERDNTEDLAPFLAYFLSLSRRVRSSGLLGAGELSMITCPFLCPLKLGRDCLIPDLPASRPFGDLQGH